MKASFMASKSSERGLAGSNGEAAGTRIGWMPLDRRKPARIVELGPDLAKGALNRTLDYWRVVIASGPRHRRAERKGFGSLELKRDATVDAFRTMIAMKLATSRNE
jgi:hypothetical protein